MADYDSSLPIMTENDGDVVVKVADASTPSQQLAVNADGSVNITDNAGSITVDSVDLDIRDLVFATDKVDVSGSEVSLDAATLAALENTTVTVDNAGGVAAVNIQDGGNSITVDAVDLDIRDLAFATDSVDVSGSSVTVSATDLDIRDLTHVSDSIKVGDGVDFLAINADGSINVVPIEDSGTETVDYNTTAAVAGGASSNHDLAFTNLTRLYQVWGSASGKLKIEVQIETGSATGIFNTILVGFNSTATPNIKADLSKFALVPAGARVRVIRTNRDNQPQDVYSTIVAVEEL